MFEIFLRFNTIRIWRYWTKYRNLHISISRANLLWWRQTLFWIKRIVWGRWSIATCRHITFLMWIRRTWMNIMNIWNSISRVWRILGTIIRWGWDKMYCYWLDCRIRVRIVTNGKCLTCIRVTDSWRFRRLMKSNGTR